MSELDVQAMRAAHQDSYPMGNIHHGTPERPDWGTSCIECKQSWPCDVTLLLDRLARAEAAVARVRALLESWEAAHTHLGIERGNWGPSSSALRQALADPSNRPGMENS